jgi:hypothetical protein
MRLYATYALLRPGSECAAAYGLLLRAGHRPVVSCVPQSRLQEQLVELTGHRRPPVLVTDEGTVVGGLSAIAGWLDRARD